MNPEPGWYDTVKGGVWYAVYNTQTGGFYARTYARQGCPSLYRSEGLAERRASLQTEKYPGTTWGIKRVQLSYMVDILNGRV